MKKIAVIDCGTNTFNLLVAEVTSEGWSVIFHNKVAVKLGEGGFEEKVISDIHLKLVKPGYRTKY